MLNDHLFSPTTCLAVWRMKLMLQRPGLDPFQPHERRWYDFYLERQRQDARHWLESRPARLQVRRRRLLTTR